MNQRLPDLLACPICLAPLDIAQSSVVCTRCQHIFPIEQGIIHFVNDKNRPEPSKNLGNLNEIKDPELYGRNARTAENAYASNAHIREYMVSRSALESRSSKNYSQGKGNPIPAMGSP